MEFRSTGDGRVAYVKGCVLYDADGVIQHVHHVVDMEGVAETPESVVAERALALARDRGLDYAALRTLHVDPSLISGAVRMRVDTSSGALVTEESATL
ncbi:hypothetical protein [Nonomuraea sp. NPDC049158]|uniref:hypothetical protein n=1 Tax=Nonomuraea sp. NPDC049158 TaxID=3155649 RepID=UPI0033EE044B